jgi:hypothetical protein
MRRVHPSIMWAKLEALVAGARIASQKLWNAPRKAAAKAPARRVAGKPLAKIVKLKAGKAARGKAKRAAKAVPKRRRAR